LKGEAQIQLRKDSITAAGQERRPAVKSLVSEEDAPLLSALKAKRRALAEQQKVPAYIIFNDKTLIEMAERRPQNLDQMASIGGVGAKKLESYGQAFLSVITGEQTSVHPARRKMAGRPEGELFDQLLARQLQLARGAFNGEKTLSCSTATLRMIAQRRPDSLEQLAQISGMTPARTERFGVAFLEILQSA
jgi:ATP-dependent DNA helicase RecQ